MTSTVLDLGRFPVFSCAGEFIALFVGVVLGGGLVVVVGLAGPIRKFVSLGVSVTDLSTVAVRFLGRFLRLCFSKSALLEMSSLGVSVL